MSFRDIGKNDKYLVRPIMVGIEIVSNARDIGRFANLSAAAGGRSRLALH